MRIGDKQEIERERRLRPATSSAPGCRGSPLVLASLHALDVPLQRSTDPPAARAVPPAPTFDRNKGKACFFFCLLP